MYSFKYMLENVHWYFVISTTNYVNFISFTHKNLIDGL